MVAIPSVKHRLLLVLWDRPGLVKRRLSVVGLPGRVGIEGLEINGSSGFSIFLRADDHPVAPCDRFTHRDGLYDSQSDISV